MEKFSKYIKKDKKEYQILENLAQAKSILRKTKNTEDDEKFQKIIKTTNRDGWTGLLTRFVFIEGKNIEEVISMYPDLKKSKLDLGKINKISFDDIVDQLYSDNKERGDGLYIGEIKNEIGNYKIFRVPSFKDGLKICSPAWCLKTKSDWDNYTVDLGGYQFVAIEETYVKNNKTSLLTPDSPQYMGGYENTKKPEVRFGITVYPGGRVDVFDDDNTKINTGGWDNSEKAHIASRIVSHIKAYMMTYKEDFVVEIKSSDEFDVIKHYFEYGIQYIKDNGMDGFYFESFMGNNAASEDYDSMIKRFFEITNENINMIFSYDEWKSFFINNKPMVLQDDFFVSNNGFMDALLYRTTDKYHPLSGSLLKERNNFDHSYTYLYGYYNKIYGRFFILQSYKEVGDWLEHLLWHFHEVFFDDQSDGNAQTVFYDYLKGYEYTGVLELYLESVDPIEHGWERPFRYKIFTKENNTALKFYNIWENSEDKRSLWIESMKETGWRNVDDLEEDELPDIIDYLGAMDVNPNLYNEIKESDRGNLTEMVDSFWLSNLKEIFGEDSIIENELGCMIRFVDPHPEMDQPM